MGAAETILALGAFVTAGLTCITVASLRFARWVHSYEPETRQNAFKERRRILERKRADWAAATTRYGQADDRAGGAAATLRMEDVDAELLALAIEEGEMDVDRPTRDHRPGSGKVTLR